MKKFLSMIAVCAMSAMVFSGCGADNQGTQGGTEETPTENSAAMDTPVDVGIIQLTEHPALDASREGFIEALAEAGYTDGDNINIETQNAQGDQSNLKTISQKFVSDGKDLILAIATPSAQAVATETKDIPILVTAVTDPAESGLVETNEVPNCNVSGTSDLTPVEDQIELLTKILPDAKKITIMYCSGEQNSLIQADMAEEAAKAAGLEVERKTVTSTNDVAQVTESIIGTCDAVYIPTDNVLASSMPLVSSITNPAGLPVIVGESGMVEGGGLASVAIDYTDLGKLTGKMAVQIIEGADIKTMPIQYAENPQLVINETAAAELGITIPDDVKASAEVVNTSADSGTEAQ
ncbi:MAG: ABC transporter substrate-binding protein [Clostridia bacterium]|nr:ABC transporter substrate-binding protein [Clostridia bacterium]